MNEHYRNATGSALLSAFEAAAFERMGMAGEYPQAATTLDTVAQKVHEDMYASIGLADDVRTSVWEKGDKAIRAVIAVGSIATGSWRFPYKRRSRVALYPRSMHSSESELADLAVLTNDQSLAVSALKAVGDEFTLLRNGVPSGFVHSAAGISRIADEFQHIQILGSMPRIYFSDGHTDTSEMDSPHGVDRFLHDESLSETFRRFLMKRALQDARKTAYKPHVWQSQMDVTLRRLAKNPDNPLRLEARQELDVPSSDEDYFAWREQQEQIKAKARAREAAVRQERLAAKGATLKAIISETLEV